MRTLWLYVVCFEERKKKEMPLLVVIRSIESIAGCRAGGDGAHSTAPAHRRQLPKPRDLPHT